MSHRESCVWHPMPDEVRRSSVQSRRASLAAGRRKQLHDEPDWEVEAPPTPPPNDYSPRQEQAQAKAAADQERAAAQQQFADEAAESREPVEEACHEPVEAAREREVAEAEAAAAAAAADADEESIAADADGKRAKTRHTIRFHGGKWSTVTDEENRKAAFLEDVADATGLKPEQVKKLQFAVEPDVMVATFYVNHPANKREQMREVHRQLREYNFTHMCALYPE